MKLASKHALATLALTALAATILTPAAAAAGCAPAAPGGEWRSFGHDLSNSRSQPDEDQITAANAYALEPAWRFSLVAAGATGGFQSIPVVADGCVYVGTNTGWVIALNADTGAVVWAESLEASPLVAGLSGGIFSVAVAEGRVYANVSAMGSPYVAALDQDTGDVLWATVVDEDPTAYTNSSVALIEDMVFIGISGPEDGPEDRRHPGGFALVDAETGDLIKRVWTVSEAEDARGIKGASLWGTPAYDPETGYLYDGTGQPANKDREATLSNALLKIDVNRNRPTFGAIVDHYKGNYDERLDVDFGGSPSFFTDEHGNQLVGAIQKSGVFHAAYADTMDQAWWVRLADPLILGSSGSPAYDGTSLYVPSALNSARYGGDPHAGALTSLRAADGTVNWSTTIGGGIDYHPVALAGGVVYIVTNQGVLLGLNAETGRPVLARAMSADVGDACVNLSGGPSIARHTVYAHCDTGATGGGWLVAYRLNPALPSLPVVP